MTLNHFFAKGLLGNLLSIIAGGLLTLAFAPFSIFPFAVLSTSLLLGLWLYVPPKAAFLRGWLFGLGFFGTSVYWVYISMHNFGNVSTLVAIFITGLFVAILALFPGLSGYFLNRYFPPIKPAKLLYAFPATWVFSEWIRSFLFSGFPWGFLGYSQISSPLKGYAPLLSVYGVSLFVLLSSGLIINAIIYIQQKKYKKSYLSLLMLILIWVIGGCLSFIHWTKPYGAPVKVSLVQGNIEQSLKWSPEQVQPTLDRYKKLTEAHWDSKIIIWPEAAVPLTLQNATDFLEPLSKTAKQKNVALLTGIPVKSPHNLGYYNAVVALGAGAGIYTKERLVPFGEFVPLSNLFQKFFAILDIPMADFIIGPESPDPIVASGIKIATFICYEIAFPEQVLSRDGKIGMILTVSNDAWFGKSIAQAQHLEMGQMRAVEMGRPVLFVSNNGLTAFIDDTGKIKSIAPPFETYVLTDYVQAMEGKTPWQRRGMDPILIILFLMLFTAIRLAKR